MCWVVTCVYFLLNVSCENHLHFFRSTTGSIQTTPSGVAVNRTYSILIYSLIFAFIVMLAGVFVYLFISNRLPCRKKQLFTDSNVPVRTSVASVGSASTAGTNEKSLSSNEPIQQTQSNSELNLSIKDTLRVND